MDIPDDPSAQERVNGWVKLLTPSAAGDDRFVGAAKPHGKGRVFGGQVVAQALAAAGMTVEQDRTVHSLHSYFLRGGSEGTAIEYHVERTRDGGSFTNRAVRAFQDGRELLALRASFHRPSDGPEHSPPMPDVSPPEELESEEAYMSRVLGEIRTPARYMQHRRGYEVRLPPDFTDLARQGRQYLWFRSLAPLPDDGRLRRVVLAYLSDYGLVSAATLRHGFAWWLGNSRGASLDHAVWLHADPRPDDWILYALRSPWAGGERGLALGRLYNRDGTHIASTAQEGLMRRT